MRGSIQRRGKDSWRLVFDLDRDQTGKRRQKAVAVTGTKREAEAELRRLVSEMENGGFAYPGTVTVAEYLAHWLEHVATKTAAKTHERYGEIVEKKVIPELGSLKLVKLRPAHVQGFYTKLLTDGRVGHDGGLSARTVLHCHRVFSQALKQAVKWQLLTRNPADAVEPPKPEEREMLALNQEQTAVLLDAALGTPLYMPILLAVTTGMRRGEILALRWAEVDMDRGKLAVTRTLEKSRKCGLQFKQPKTKKSRRSISLAMVTIDALRKCRVEQAELRLQLGCGWDENGLVCCHPDGEPFNPSTVTSGFASLVSGLDIPRVTFHGLRHTHATHLFQEGIHPKVAQERLGHSTIAITLDLYSHVMPGMQEDAAKKVDIALQAAIRRRSENDN